MATAGLNRMTLWGDFEGRRLEDRWLLGRLVRPEGRHAWFEAIGPDGVPVMLSITEALNDEDELLERLAAAKEIRHPNVVAIREAAVSHLDDVPVIVAAMEMTEENLGDVLRERLLTAAEGRQVLDAVLAALGAMHGHGLLHGHVEANSVLAMGETVKLRSDCVRIGDSRFSMAAAEDVRACARMATHSVTGRFPANENDPVLQLLPEAMARAVRRALSGSAGATEVAALAGTKLELLPDIQRGATRIEPLSKSMKIHAADASMDKSAGMGELKKADESKTAMKARNPASRVVAMRAIDIHAQAALFGEPAMLSSEREVRSESRAAGDDAEVTRWPRAPYVIAAAIAVVLVTVFTVYGLLHSQTVEQKPSAPAATAATAAATMAPHAAMESAAMQVPEASGTGWRVVAYTFNTEEEARETAKMLAQRFSQLNPGVFVPKGGELWLVTLGGIMSRGDALVLRDRAVNMGLPEDTYAQNFR